MPNKKKRTQNTQTLKNNYQRTISSFLQSFFKVYLNVLSMSCPSPYPISSLLNSSKPFFDKSYTYKNLNTFCNTKHDLDLNMSSKEEIVQGFQQMCQMQRYIFTF